MACGPALQGLEAGGTTWCGRSHIMQSPHPRASPAVLVSKERAGLTQLLPTEVTQVSVALLEASRTFSSSDSTATLTVSPPTPLGTCHLAWNPPDHLGTGMLPSFHPHQELPPRAAEPSLSRPVGLGGTAPVTGVQSPALPACCPRRGSKRAGLSVLLSLRPAPSISAPSPLSVCRFLLPT